jgi:hypothetical protein
LLLLITSIETEGPPRTEEKAHLPQEEQRLIRT